MVTQRASTDRQVPPTRHARRSKGFSLSLTRYRRRRPGVLLGAAQRGTSRRSSPPSNSSRRAHPSGGVSTPVKRLLSCTTLGIVTDRSHGTSVRTLTGPEVERIVHQGSAGTVENAAAPMQTRKTARPGRRGAEAPDLHKSGGTLVLDAADQRSPSIRRTIGAGLASSDGGGPADDGEHGQGTAARSSCLTSSNVIMSEARVSTRPVSSSCASSRRMP